MATLHAGVMELVDVVDSKSTASDGVPVRVRPPAPELDSSQTLDVTGFVSFLFCLALGFFPVHSSEIGLILKWTSCFRANLEVHFRCGPPQDTPP